MNNTRRIIKSQGDLDSACFLYSLVNAAQCLSGKELGNKEWQCLISCVYDCKDYLTGSTGTKRIDHLPELISTLTVEYLKVLDPKRDYRVKILEKISKDDDLNTLLTKHSLLLIDNGEHWFCLLEVDDEYAYIACSAVWQDNRNSYREEKTPRLKRIYNDKFPVDELGLIKGRILLVSA